MRCAALSDPELESIMQVKDIYTHGTVHIPQTCNLQQAAAQMRQQHVGALVVTDGDAGLLGIVTDRDMVLRALAVGASPLQTLVGDVMTAGTVSIDVDAGLDDAMQAMTSHGVRRLAVTGADRRVLGIVSLDDLIEAQGRSLGLLASILGHAQQRERSGSVQSPLHP